MLFFWFVYYMFFFNVTSWIHRNEKHMFGYVLRNKGKSGNFSIFLTFVSRDLFMKLLHRFFFFLSQHSLLVASPRMGRQQGRAWGSETAPRREGSCLLGNRVWPSASLCYYRTAGSLEGAKCQVHAKEEALVCVEWGRQWLCLFCLKDFVPFPVPLLSSSETWVELQKPVCSLFFSLFRLSCKARP